MAKKKTKRKSYSKKKGKFDMDNTIDGFLSEIGPQIISNFIGEELSGPVTHAAIGYFRNNPVAWFRAGEEFAEIFGAGGLGGLLGGGNNAGPSFWE